MPDVHLLPRSRARWPRSRAPGDPITAREALMVLEAIADPDERAHAFDNAPGDGRARRATKRRPYVDAW